MSLAAVPLPEEGPVASHVVDVEGVPMSALVARVAAPRAVVVALHGGGASARYFDHPTQERPSLLRTGHALGFTMVALDRPGYGASAPLAAEVAPAARRVELAYAAVERLVPADARGAGLFVVAHSLGSELALRMACDPHGADLLGVEIAGTGRVDHPVAAQVMEAARRSSARPPGLRDMIWGPAHLYPPEVLRHPGLAASTPRYEGAVVTAWAERDFPDLAAGVRVPVRYCLADHETVWRGGSAAMAEVAALFTAAPRVVVAEQAGSGHNLSLGRAALAYHLGLLAFVEECVLERLNQEVP